MGGTAYATAIVNPSITELDCAHTREACQMLTGYFSSHPPHCLLLYNATYDGCLFRCSAADEPQDPVVAQSAFMLYGMIHARFIVTARGLEAMVSVACVSVFVLSFPRHCIFCCAAAFVSHSLRPFFRLLFAYPTTRGRLRDAVRRVRADAVAACSSQRGYHSATNIDDDKSHPSFV